MLKQQPHHHSRQGRVVQPGTFLNIKVAELMQQAPVGHLQPLGTLHSCQACLTNGTHLSMSPDCGCHCMTKWTAVSSEHGPCLHN